MAAMPVSRAARGLLLVVALVAWPTLAQARNANLEKARQELDELHFDEAAAALEKALFGGGNGPDDLVEIFELSARVAAARGDAASAEDFFRRLLSLAPDYALPAGTSPKIAEPFAAARRWLTERLPITARWEESTDAPGVTVVVDADPLGMVGGAAALVTVDGKQERIERSGEAPFALPLPRASRVELRIFVLDQYGNRLIEFGMEEPLVVDTSRAGEQPPPGGGDTGKRRSGRSFVAKWWLWGGVALVAGGAGAYFGLDVLAAQDELEDLNRRTQQGEMIDFSEAVAVQDRGERSALAANVAFGVAGASALAAIILFVTEPDAEPSKDTATRVLPTVGAGQVGLGVVTRF
jgi:hypothetical protein